MELVGSCSDFSAKTIAKHKQYGQGVPKSKIMKKGNFKSLLLKIIKK